MTQEKKFDYRIVQQDTTWTAQITRRMTARKTVVSKSKKGFATEAEAKAWGETELKAFLENLVKRNERRAKQREVRTEAAEAKELAADTWRNARDAEKESANGDLDEDSLDYESDA